MNKQDKGPSGVGIFISVTFPWCVPFQRMNGALKSFSLNNLFSCELCCCHTNGLWNGASSTLCIIYFCISQRQKKKKKDLKKIKNKQTNKKQTKQKYRKENEDHVDRSWLWQAVMFTCAYMCNWLLYFGGEQTSRGIHKLYFYTQNCKLDFDRSLPNHISLFEIV